MATLEATDPIVICRIDTASQGGNMSWYSYTTGATVQFVNLTTATSDHDSMVSVYTGSPGDFRLDGGPTQTHMLTAASPPVDAGNPAGCSDYYRNRFSPPAPRRAGSRR